MTSTHQIGSGRALFDLPGGRFFGAMTQRITPKCRCCDGTGIVPDATGKPRPCSRCQAEGFMEWAEQVREAAIHLAVFVVTFPILFQIAHWLRG